MTDETWLVSACLLGVACRYDGDAAKAATRAAVLAALHGKQLVPICPEVAGGLQTPRAAAQLDGGDGAAVLDGAARVVTDAGVDVTEAFVEGSRRALAAAERFGATGACLKARSPSCGCGSVHRRGLGVIDGSGVTAAALQRAGLRVVSDEDL